jgi:hypothetical protein
MDGGSVMSENIRIMRAYRPSSSAAASQEESSEERQQKEDNVRIYAQRAVRGLPLFVEADPPPTVAGA